MPIKLKCSCGQNLSVPDNLAGKSGKCPKCQKSLQIPIPATGKAAATAITGATAKASSAKSTAAPSAIPGPSASVQIAAVQPTNKFDSLLDDVGLKKKTGPVCPKCGQAFGKAPCFVQYAA